MMTIATTTTRVLHVPAHSLAATGTPFQGRTVSADRRGALLKRSTMPVLGFRTPAGVDLDATTIPRGTSMI